MARALKVFRTAIGFHDAYVAAPSRKAALEAWGSDRDLFTRGAAELVTDAALAAEPLARPGEVIRRLRGTAAEQIAALPQRRTKTEAPAAPEKVARKAPEPKARKTLRPDRAPLAAAERALADAEARHAADRKALAAEEDALAKRRRALEKAAAAELDRLEKAKRTAAGAYERAMRDWRG